MKRDMDLIRKILFKIEEDFQPGQPSMFNLKIDGYDMETIAEHCDQLFQQGLIKRYKPTYADDGLYGFHIGNLTARGYDYLELIRNNEVWEKTKTEIETKKRPQTLEEIAKIAGVFTGNVLKEFHS